MVDVSSRYVNELNPLNVIPCNFYEGAQAWESWKRKDIDYGGKCEKIHLEQTFMRGIPNKLCRIVLTRRRGCLTPRKSVSRSPVLIQKSDSRNIKTIQGAIETEI